MRSASKPTEPSTSYSYANAYSTQLLSRHSRHGTLPSLHVSAQGLDRLYAGRPIQRFWFLETVARMPYFSYISMLHLYESLGWWRAGAELRRVRPHGSPLPGPPGSHILLYVCWTTRK